MLVFQMYREVSGRKICDQKIMILGRQLVDLCLMQQQRVADVWRMKVVAGRTADDWKLREGACRATLEGQTR